MILYLRFIKICLIIILIVNRIVKVKGWISILMNSILFKIKNIIKGELGGVKRDILEFIFFLKSVKLIDIHIIKVKLIENNIFLELFKVRGIIFNVLIRIIRKIKEWKKSVRLLFNLLLNICDKLKLIKDLVNHILLIK